MELPEVEAVGSEPREALVQLLERTGSVTSADLRHQKQLVAMSADGLADENLRTSAGVLPRRVDERHPLIDRVLDDADRFGGRDALTRDVATADREDRDLLAGISERPFGKAGHLVVTSP